MSLYDELGVDQNASEEEIKKAYKRRAKKTHPDKGGSEEEFKKTNQAYLVLSNPKRRERYDETGDMSEDREIDDTLQRISELFFFVLDQYGDNVFKIDIVDEMINCIESAIQKFNAEKLKIDVLIKKDEMMIGRITREDGKENVFDALISGRIAEHKRKKASADQQIDINKKMQSFLDVYMCEVDNSSEESEDEIPHHFRHFFNT